MATIEERAEALCEELGCGSLDLEPIILALRSARASALQEAENACAAKYVEFATLPWSVRLPSMNSANECAAAIRALKGR